MEGFKLSHNSWHSKLFKYFKSYRPDSSNFCEYFWTIVGEIVGRMIIVLYCLFVVFAIVFALATEPLKFIIFALAICGSGLIIALIIYLGTNVYDYISEFRKPKPKKIKVKEYKGPGFFKLKYMAVKGKYCPKIEWSN